VPQNERKVNKDKAENRKNYRKENSGTAGRRKESAEKGEHGDVGRKEGARERERGRAKRREEKEEEGKTRGSCASRVAARSRCYSSAEDRRGDYTPVTQWRGSIYSGFVRRVVLRNKER